MMNPQPPWTDKWLDADTGLSVWRNGVTTNTRAVVLLHCIGLDSTMWSELAVKYLACTPAIAVDLPGHGASEPLEGDWSLQQVADVVAAALRKIDVAEAVIVGISAGGMVAQHLAMRHPEAASALLLADTNYRQAPSSRANLHARAEEARKHGMSALAGSTCERWFSESFRARRPTCVAATRRRLECIDPETHARWWEAIAGLDVGQSLAEVKLPTSVLCGELDSSTGPQTAREIVRLMPNARYVEVAGAGHISVFEDVDAWGRALGDLRHAVTAHPFGPFPEDSQVAWGASDYARKASHE